MSTDHGKKPYVLDIEAATIENPNFRTTLWTGEHLQLTLMSIPVGGDIGLEVHPDNDQFLRLEQGKGLVQMGPAEDDLPFRREEVEAAVGHHPAVYDVVVVGRPSARWGSEVVALVQLAEGTAAGPEVAASIIAEAGRHIARYKLPKDVLFRDRVLRSPSGKADYRWAKAEVS